MNGPLRSSLLFRVTATAFGTVAAAIGLALLAGLTGGAILAPLCFIALFTPLIAVQYLLWGRFLNRALRDEEHSLGDIDEEQADETFLP